MKKMFGFLALAFLLLTLQINVASATSDSPIPISEVSIVLEGYESNRNPLAELIKTSTDRLIIIQEKIDLLIQKGDVDESILQLCRTLTIELSKYHASHLLYAYVTLPLRTLFSTVFKNKIDD